MPAVAPVTRTVGMREAYGEVPDPAERGSGRGVPLEDHPHDPGGEQREGGEVGRDALAAPKGCLRRERRAAEVGDVTARRRHELLRVGPAVGRRGRGVHVDHSGMNCEPGRPLALWRKRWCSMYLTQWPARPISPLVSTRSRPVG